jgi:hypothetical protein
MGYCALSLAPYTFHRANDETQRPADRRRSCQWRRSVEATTAIEREAPEMAASDDLRKLSDRAKVAEDHAAEAKTQAQADLERTASDVRASAEAQAKQLRDQAQAAGRATSATWDDMQRSWSAHVAKVRGDVEQRKAEIDASNASVRADWAESDAELAVGYAYAAIEEAEYAVLDAVLARREADVAGTTASR